jgi:hypothetical protein
LRGAARYMLQQDDYVPRPAPFIKGSTRFPI